MNEILDIKRFSEAIITSTGEIVGWTGPSEIALLNVWGAGDDLTRSLDKIFSVDALVPPRPTISNMQWLSGTTYITPADMDKLSKLPTSYIVTLALGFIPCKLTYDTVGGPDRPPSQRMIEQMRADEQAQRLSDRKAQNSVASSSAAATSGAANEGYWAYMVG